MSGRQRCFGIVRFGPYPDGADPTIIDDARFAALQKLAEAQAAEGFEYLDQLGVGEWVGEFVTEQLSREEPA